MDKLMNSINTRIKYILNNSNNEFIIHRCEIINTKLDELKERKYKDKETVYFICSNIIYVDIAKMKGVSGQTNMVYKKMDELTGFIEDLKTVYFDK